MPEGTTPEVPEGTTPEEPEVILPEVPEGTTPEVPEVILPEVPEGTTPEVPEGTTPEVPEVILPEVPEGTTPEVPEGTTPVVPEGTTPVLPEGATPVVPGGTIQEKPEGSTPVVPGEGSSACECLDGVHVVGCVNYKPLTCECVDGVHSENCPNNRVGALMMLAHKAADLTSGDYEYKYNLKVMMLDNTSTESITFYNTNLDSKEIPLAKCPKFLYLSESVIDRETESVVYYKVETNVLTFDDEQLEGSTLNAEKDAYYYITADTLEQTYADVIEIIDLYVTLQRYTTIYDDIGNTYMPWDQIPGEYKITEYKKYDSVWLVKLDIDDTWPKGYETHTWVNIRLLETLSETPTRVNKELIEKIYGELLESVSKEGYDETFELYAEELKTFTFTEEQQTILDAYRNAIPYIDEIVYTPWSGRVGALMPPISIVSMYTRMNSRMLRSGVQGSGDGSATYGVSREAAPIVDNNALVTTKTIRPVEDGKKYNITIEAYAEGNVTVTTTKNPCDVILVLDESYSMRSTFVHPTTRIQALKDAAQKFVEAIGEDAKGPDGLYNTGDEIHHRVSVITYHSSVNLRNALKDISDQQKYNAIHTSVSNFNPQIGTRSDLGLEKAKDVFAGTNLTNDKNDTVPSGERQRVVLFFTDGYPTVSNNTHFNVDYATKAIEEAYLIKNNYGAAIYSVAVLNNADPKDPDLETQGESGENPDIGLVNAYLHAVSSNYPGARASIKSGKMTITLGTKEYSDYYLSAKDPAELNEIFNTVASTTINGSTNVNLGTETVVKDIVTPYFVIPKGATVNVSTADCTGFSSGTPQWGTASALSGNKVKVDGVELKNGNKVEGEGNVLDVSGFDFKSNFVASTARPNPTTGQTNFFGRKLIISFDIEVIPDFLGGDDVPTNGTASGVYAPDGTLCENLIPDPPHVDIPLKEIDTVAEDKHIYYGNTTDMTGILNLNVTVSSSGKDLQDIANKINNAYVDLVYHVTLADSTIVTYTIPAGYNWDEGTWRDASDVVINNMNTYEVFETTPYGITCTMISKNAPSKTEQATGTANIYVYKPVITFQDTLKKQFDGRVAYPTENYVSTVWKSKVKVKEDGVEKEVNVEIDGKSDTKLDGKSAPNITLHYTQPENCIYDGGLVITGEDFYVNVAVDIGTITNANEEGAVTFQHKKCDAVSKCQFEPENGQFIIHVEKVYGSLTIKKTVTTAIPTGENQVFVFHVYKVDGTETHLMDVSISTNDMVVDTTTGLPTASVTISNLPLGTYKVTEDTSWSWRYELTKVENNVIALGWVNNTKVLTDTASFKNTRTKNKWLNFFDAVKNLFTASTPVNNAKGGGVGDV